MPDAPANGHSLFEQGWWLEAVAPGQWGEVVLGHPADPHARLPYVLRRRFGLTTITHPPLTPVQGPWIRSSATAYAKRLAHEHQHMEQLIAALPEFDLFRQQFAPAVTNALPFRWAGFDVSVRYTYRLEDLSDLDRVWAECRQNLRANVRKAREVVTVRDDLGLDAFLSLNAMTFRRQGLPVPYTQALVERVDSACAQRGARRMVFAVDAHDRAHAALYLVWDRHAAYYLMGGADPDLRASGAMSLLMWEAIGLAARVTTAFDFEGSMLRPVERFFRSFGARQVPCLQVTRRNLRAGAAETVRRIGERAARPRGSAATARR